MRCPIWTVVFLLLSAPAWAEWRPQRAPLMTRWAKDVTPDTAHREYPRPQLVREHWLNLNGLWDYAITSRDAERPTTWDGQILVPFPVESALSGVMQSVGPERRLWYRRSFTLPEHAAWSDKTILLHFGAVDWDATVWINGKEVVQHRGGFDPFSADVTAALQPGRDNELLVSVWDPSDAGFQPRGKQVRNPHGIWYTPVTGIWQTVWLEPVPKTYIRGLQLTPRMDKVKFGPKGIDFNPGEFSLGIKLDVGGDPQGIELGVQRVSPDPNTPLSPTTAQTGFVPVAKLLAGDEFQLSMPVMKGESGTGYLWFPHSPVLHELQLVLTRRDPTTNQRVTVDEVGSYCAMRHIAAGKDERGLMRLLLNGQPLFQYGTLDQGWWPDGLYTAPTDEALKFDIDITKRYGFNMIRKHVKVEPDRWYYWCDKLGMLVWQDMPSGDRHAQWDPFGKFNGQEITRSAESAANFRIEWRRIIDARRNHPSIVTWVPFNEAWGQFDTVAVTNWTKEYDPTRLVNCASGGNDFPVGDIVDYHRYPGPFAPATEPTRAAVLGEYGGLGLPLQGHTWQDEKNWGYRSFTSQEALTEAYLDLLDKLHPLIGDKGLAAAIYTQTTDVEIEVNGLLTYDRAVEKLPVKTLAAAHQRLWRPAPQVSTVLPTAETTAATWRYTTDKPADGWFQPDFDAAGWKTGPAGFGEPSTPGAHVQTVWKSPDIWLRRTFDVAQLPAGELRLRMHHDEDAEVYLNGVLIKQVTGYTTDYAALRLAPEAQRALRAGPNTLAVHCHQTGGGQYIDVGFEAWESPPPAK